MIQHRFVYFSVKANYAWQLGDEVASKHHAKKAKIFVIVGILAGVATYALSIGLIRHNPRTKFKTSSLPLKKTISVPHKNIIIY
jgi:hypothetical protein